jgi:hypothetical protein
MMESIIVMVKKLVFMKYLTLFDSLILMGIKIQGKKIIVRNIFFVLVGTP